MKSLLVTIVTIVFVSASIKTKRNVITARNPENPREIVDLWGQTVDESGRPKGRGEFAFE